MVKKKAFTLIEILIVIFIIGILSATLIPRIGNARKKTEEAVELIKANRNIACTEGLDDMCDSPSGNSTQAFRSGLHYVGNDITICREGRCITMQDRNLGATKTGIKCDTSDTGACGYHYQWGNNHGFTNPGKDGSDEITSSAINKTTSTQGFGPSNYFSSGIFRKVTSSPYDWSNPKNDNLWGGKNDGASNNWGYDLENNVAYNVEDRQGPCPQGYHVPSAGERGTLLKYWAENYTGTTITLNETYPLQYFQNVQAKTQFQNDFYIPWFPGNRFYKDASVRSTGPKGNARLWSSSTDGNNARYFYVMSSFVYAKYTDYRANAYSVRCFKN